MRPRRGLAATTALLSLLWTAGPAAATTWYVRADGNDDHDGLTPASALASVRPAARRLREPGDRLIVGPGTYREGNISPFGNGTPEAPMVLFGDASGASTGDPPGRVLIVPPNTPKADSGFLIRGRHDVVIEGFEISGASDAGIEVRDRVRTGEASTRIALRHNRVIGCRKGIQLFAEGEVELTGNHLVGADPPTAWAGDGLVVRGGTMRLRMAGNVFADRFIGIRGGGMLEAVLDNNELRTQARNVQFGADRLTLIGNRLLGPLRGGEFYARELIAVDNQVQGSIAFGATDLLEIERNTIAGVAMIRQSPARVRIAENTFSELSIGGGGDVAVTDNQGQLLKSRPVETMVATGNRFTDAMKVRATGTAAVTDNQVGGLVVRAGIATVEANIVARKAIIAADEATVIDNTAAALAVQARHRTDEEPPLEGGMLTVRDNTVDSELAVGGVATVVVAANTVSGPLKAAAFETIEVTDNEARGITCLARTTGTDVTLRENRSRHGRAGLAVIGAESATVEDNVAAENVGAGLVVRRTARLLAAGNELRANGQGGASIRVPPTGDCDENVDVTVDELVTVVGLTLQRRPFHECDAADANRDRAVTVDEVVLSVGAALGRPDPLVSSVELRDNRVEDNGRFGLDVNARAAITATGNRVLRNSGIALAVKGLLPLSEALVSGNVLGGSAAEGLMIAGVERSEVRDNVVFSSREAGILLRAAPNATVINNLVYANGRAGIVAGLGYAPTDVTDISRNTFFANGRGGLTLGEHSVTSTGTTVRNNIINENLVAGLTVVENATVSLTVERNVNTDGYSENVTPGETDIDADPLFVDPDGPDGILGEQGFADDDFRLQPGSPAIDGIGFRYPDQSP